MGITCSLCLAIKGNKMEKSKIISDIRVYKSVVDNIDGNSMPASLGNKPLNITVQRIVMKLRENGFSLGAFDHLYINLTTCIEPGQIQQAKRSVDRHHPWYRYYDVGIKPELFDVLGSEAAIGSVVEKVEQVLIASFSADKATEQMIQASVKEAVELGPDMLMRFKEKKSAKCTAILYLRQLDNVKYKPLLCVYDLEGKELLREDLPETLELNAFGEILLSSKKVTIKPRKNFFTRDMEPITFVFG